MKQLLALGGDDVRGTVSRCCAPAGQRTSGQSMGAEAGMAVVCAAGYKNVTKVSAKTRN